MLPLADLSTFKFSQCPTDVLFRKGNNGILGSGIRLRRTTCYIWLACHLDNLFSGVFYDLHTSDESRPFLRLSLCPGSPLWRTHETLCSSWGISSGGTGLLVTLAWTPGLRQHLPRFSVSTSDHPSLALGSLGRGSSFSNYLSCILWLENGI